jgi:hypothetical protein
MGHNKPERVALTNQKNTFDADRGSSGIGRLAGLSFPRNTGAAYGQANESLCAGTEKLADDKNSNGVDD